MAPSHFSTESSQASHRVDLEPFCKKVTLLEYGDFASSESRLAARMVRGLREEYSDRLCFEFRHFPARAPGDFDLAGKAAEAAEAARAQGAFIEMHDLIFERQHELSSENLVRFADELELDVRKFQQELYDGTYGSLVQAHAREAEERGIQKSPVFFVNGEALGVHSNIELVRRRIKRALDADDYNQAA